MMKFLLLSMFLFSCVTNNEAKLLKRVKYLQKKLKDCEAEAMLCESTPSYRLGCESECNDWHEGEAY